MVSTQEERQGQSSVRECACYRGLEQPESGEEVPVEQLGPGVRVDRLAGGLYGQSGARGDRVVGKWSGRSRGMVPAAFLASAPCPIVGERPFSDQGARTALKVGEPLDRIGTGS